MKKKLSIIFVSIFILFIGANINCFARTIVSITYIKSDGGGYSWSTSPSTGLPGCASGSSRDCKVQINYDDGSHIVLGKTITGSFHIVKQMPQVTFINVNTNATVVSSNVSGLVLDNGFYLNIKSCDEYPELTGRSISLSGVTVNANNQIDFTFN
jgi:hypothetical protein